MNDDKVRAKLEFDAAELKDAVVRIEDDKLNMHVSLDGTRIEPMNTHDELPEFRKKLEEADERLRRYVAEKSDPDATAPHAVRSVVRRSDT